MIPPTIGIIESQEPPEAEPEPDPGFTAVEAPGTATPVGPKAATPAPPPPAPTAQTPAQRRPANPIQDITPPPQLGTPTPAR